jgi:hypothetical protein
MFVRRRPLLRGAMIGGAGYLAGRSAARASEREQEQEARLEGPEAQQPPAPMPAAAPAPAAGGDLVSQLQELKTLQDEGVLTPDEFEAAKRQLLAG